MEKCKVCGRDGAPHLECVDPNVSVTLEATRWIRILDSLAHYHKLLEAFDPGGEHRDDSAWLSGFEDSVSAKISQAVKSGRKEHGA